MKYLSILTAALVLFSCKEQKGKPDKVENNGDKVYSVEPDDIAINRAVDSAKATYSRFLEDFKRQDSSAGNFVIKIRFSYEGDIAEHIWVNELHFKTGKLFGILNSIPAYVTTLKMGDTLEVKKEDISDWMYVRNNKMIGGYALRALYSKMSEKERKELREELDFDIE